MRQSLLNQVYRDHQISIRFLVMAIALILVYFGLLAIRGGASPLSPAKAKSATITLTKDSNPASGTDTASNSTVTQESTTSSGGSAASSTNSSSTEVTVNGQSVEVPANGSTEQTITTPDGQTTTVTASNNQTQTGTASGSSTTRTHLYVHSSTYSNVKEVKQ